MSEELTVNIYYNGPGDPDEIARGLLPAIEKAYKKKSWWKRLRHRILSFVNKKGK